jgi:hypothetical protein
MAMLETVSNISDYPSGCGRVFQAKEEFRLSSLVVGSAVVAFEWGGTAALGCAAFFTCKLKRMAGLDGLVDRFVQVVSTLADQVPEGLRTGERSFAGDPFWLITALSNNWVSDVEDRLPFQLPKLYRSLVTRYSYDEFEIGPILFLANSDEQSGRALLSRDEMAPVLLKEVLLPCGHPSGGSYDAVCFATRRGGKDDAPIVQVDHEDVLIRGGRITIKREISPSFRDFIERVIAGEFSR